jgi:hypothetical protein
MLESPVSDRSFLFVCYQPGSGGEKLSTQISNFAECNTLEYYTTPEDRTVITNEFFDKVFLNPGWALGRILDTARQILTVKHLSDKLHVIPSHWDYNSVKPWFPNSKFVRIVHNNHDTIIRNGIKKVSNGQFKSFLELKGYCLMYVTEANLQRLLAQKKLNTNMTIGKVHEILFSESVTFDDPKRPADYTVCINNHQVFNLWYNKFDQYQVKVMDFLKTSSTIF